MATGSGKSKVAIDLLKHYNPQGSKYDNVLVVPTEKLRDENWKEEFKFESFSIWEYFNSGMMVINKKHAPIFKYLTDFFRNNEKTCLSLYQKHGVGNDQPLVNFIARKFTDIGLLPYQFNMTDMIRKNILYNLEYLEIKGLYHFNAIPNNQSGLWMKKTYEELYDRH
jgi:hypothetical protein